MTKKSKLESVVFSPEFCRTRIASMIPNPEGIADKHALEIATQLDVLPTANIGTYTPEKKEKGVYCVIKGLSGFREAAFVRLSDASKPLNEALPELYRLQEDFAVRQADLNSVIETLEKKVSK